VQNRSISEYFSGFSILSLVFGAGFLSACLIVWWFLRFKAVVFFGVSMFFAGLANSLSCLVLYRMEVAGYGLGYWRWFAKDLKLYSEYWRIAPEKGWSRFVLGGAMLCFLLAAAFLLAIPTFAPNPFAR
jgi:hypothetical protein